MSTPERTAHTPKARGSRAVRAWTWLVALGGAALLAVAAAEIVDGEGDRGGGVTWLVLAGGVLAVGPILFDRLIRVSVGPDGFRFDLSEVIAGLGAPDTARRLDRWGGGLAEAAYAYASAHTVLTSEEMRAARVRLQDHFVDTAAASALVQQYDATEVRRLFRDGPPVVRVLVLGLMLGDPSLADATTVESAITESRTANEQFHGLRLAEKIGRRLPPEDRRRLRQAIEREPIPTGHDRTELRASVLVLLADDTGGGEGPGDDGRADPGRSAATASRPGSRRGGDDRGVLAS